MCCASVPMVPVLAPHPISREELRAGFSPGSGWDVAAIEPDRLQTRYHDGAAAWLATGSRVTRAGSPGRNAATKATNEGRLTASQAITAVVRYSYQRASDVV